MSGNKRIYTYSTYILVQSLLVTFGQVLLQRTVGDHVREAVGEGGSENPRSFCFSLKFVSRERYRVFIQLNGGWLAGREACIEDSKDNNLVVESVTKFLLGCGQAGQSIVSEPGARPLTLPAMWVPPPRQMHLR